MWLIPRGNRQKGGEFLSVSQCQVEKISVIWIAVDDKA
jgi:hypothetical protein